MTRKRANPASTTTKANSTTSSSRSPDSRSPALPPSPADPVRVDAPAQDPDASVARYRPRARSAHQIKASFAFPVASKVARYACFALRPRVAPRVGEVLHDRPRCDSARAERAHEDEERLTDTSPLSPRTSPNVRPTTVSAPTVRKTPIEIEQPTACPEAAVRRRHVWPRRGHRPIPAPAARRPVEPRPRRLRRRHRFAGDDRRSWRPR